MASPMKGLLKGLRYIARIFEDEKEPEMQIGQPTDVKHVAHIGWEGPSAATPSWMHDFKSQDRTKAEPKGSSNKKPGSSREKQRNKGRRKTSTSTNNSPTESPTRVGGSTRPSKRSTGKQKEQNIGSGSESGSGLDLTQQTNQSMGPKQSKQKKAKASTTRGEGGEPSPPVEAAKSKETDISVRAVYPCAGLGSSTGR
ncbi:CRIB domain-containing protein RIC5 [Cardamine amara subsp. amara]|uniref:CRIB domain-containing protein RIC5 n=1 Tax=Cardamine amara subsp. amara TaxID=228776 RepID=A0ABD1AW10_CARAN